MLAELLVLVTLLVIMVEVEAELRVRMERVELGPMERLVLEEQEVRQTVELLLGVREQGLLVRSGASVTGVEQVVVVLALLVTLVVNTVGEVVAIQECLEMV
jgi:hypothetical protein